jgi:hypothetical protein
MKRALITWEKKILRKIYGLTYVDGYWGIKMNEELCNKFKSPDVVTVIKVCR